MLNLNSLLKDKNIKLSFKRNKPKNIEQIQNNSVPFEEVFISFIFIFIRLKQAH